MSKRTASSPYSPRWTGPIGHEATRICDHPGCQEPGLYRAPRSRRELNRYYWFCLEHVRAYNKAWNYCDGMSPGEMENEVRSTTTWERPSWPLGGWAKREDDLREGVRRSFFKNDPDAEDAAEERDNRRARFDRAPDTPETRALRLFDLVPPVSFDEIKGRYKELAKKHHPDTNGGSRQAEEQLKAINEAYAVLKAAMAP